MRTASLSHLQANGFTVLLTAIKVILPLLILLYGIFHFSPAQWLAISMVAAGVLAISFKLVRTSSTPHHADVTVKQSVLNSDGGTFRQPQQSKPQAKARPVVYDGGIVKNKTSVSGSRS